jgi:Four helix bundle sensory module for signal transduction
MEQKTNRFYGLLPWIITFAVLGAFTLYSTVYKVDYNPFEIKSVKGNLLSSMRIHLLEAIESEKNAVMAITDEESETYAAKARQASDSVENSRKEIESIIHKGEFQRETERFNEFNACWTQYRKLDETILNLAVQNTNLKAQKISSTQCAQEMALLDGSLKRIIERNKKDKQCSEAAMLAYEALTASLNIYALHKPHIEEADDQAMDKIEQRIKSYDESAKNSLRELIRTVDPSNREDLKNAENAYFQFMNLTSEVIRLSRMNTNIKSAELSLGKKRLISSQCQESLAALQEAVEAQQPKATR